MWEQMCFIADRKWQTANTWRVCIWKSHINERHCKCFFYWFTNCSGRSKVATDTMIKDVWLTCALALKRSDPQSYSIYQDGTKQMERFHPFCQCFFIMYDDVDDGLVKIRIVFFKLLKILVRSASVSTTKMTNCPLKETHSSSIRQPGNLPQQPFPLKIQENIVVFGV